MLDMTVPRCWGAGRHLAGCHSSGVRGAGYQSLRVLGATVPRCRGRRVLVPACGCHWVPQGHICVPGAVHQDQAGH